MSSAGGRCGDCVVYDQSPLASVLTLVFVPSVPVIVIVQFLRPTSPASSCPFVLASRYSRPLSMASTFGAVFWTLKASYLQLRGATG